VRVKPGGVLFDGLPGGIGVVGDAVGGTCAAAGVGMVAARGVRVAVLSGVGVGRGVGVCGTSVAVGTGVGVAIRSGGASAGAELHATPRNVNRATKASSARLFFMRGAYARRPTRHSGVTSRVGNRRGGRGHSAGVAYT